jgi:hypothetical protein
MSSPSIWDESSGVYLGFDGKVHTKLDYMDHVYNAHCGTRRLLA